MLRILDFISEIAVMILISLLLAGIMYYLAVNGFLIQGLSGILTVLLLYKALRWIHRAIWYKKYNVFWTDS